MKNLKKQSCVKIVANVFIIIVLLMSFSCTPEVLEDSNLDIDNNEIFKTVGDNEVIGQDDEED